jgi:protein-S-isoprenylcysteine O-methyltransferase Ste14
MKLVRSIETRVPPPVWALLAGGTMAWLDARWPGYDFGATAAGPLLAFAGAGTGVAGLAIAADSLRRFVAARTTWHPTHPERATALVIAGAYRYTRNPMYLGLLLVLIGWGLLLGSVAALAVVPVWMAVLTKLQIEPEERALLDRFGGEYAQYRDSVRRWLGRR